MWTKAVISVQNVVVHEGEGHKKARLQLFTETSVSISKVKQLDRTPVHL